LDLYINLIGEELRNHDFSTKRHNNLTPRLREALKRLKNNTEIIIKPADKGGSVVIQNTIDYIKEAMRQLSNPTHYELLSTVDPTFKTNNRLSKDLKEILTTYSVDLDIIDKLITKQPRTPCLYLLPKIHKPNTPGRPIVSATAGPTDLLSRYIDTKLRPHVVKIPSYIKDTRHFLQIIQSHRHIPTTATLCTIDVSSLYTNIPHDEGTAACVKVLNPNSKPPPDAIGQFIQLVLGNNIFEFNEKFYKQIHGTAMGTAMAPSYANLFMQQIEEAFLATSHLQPYLWIRYIDDIFMIWLHNQYELDKFIIDLNQFHHTIKFTHECSTTTINFLDVTITHHEGTLHTRSYHKPTDANNYLHYKSCHPRHQKESIPFSQFLRMKRNSSTDEWATESINKLTQAFKDRGYPLQTLEKSVQAVSSITQDQLLNSNPTRKEAMDKLIYVTTYHPCGPKIKKILTHFVKILSRHPHTNHINENKFITAYRRPTNLKDLLVHSRFKPNNTLIQSSGTYKCHQPRCHSCPHVIESPNFTNIDGSRPFNTRQRITCQTNYVIYIITCQKCHKKYVGQTSKNLKVRTYQHLYTIKRELSRPVAIHFNSYGHNLKHMGIQAICTAPRDDNARLALEHSWIKLIGSYQPWGLNIKT